MTSPVAQITDYEKRCQENALGQFWDDPIAQALLGVFGAEIQRLENVAYDMLTKIDLDHAGCVGAILDRIGRIARVNRLGRTDADFKLIVQVAIAARDSDGGVEQIIWIASQLVGVPVRYSRYGTAAFMLEYESDDALSDDLKAEAVDLIGRAVSAGVAWRLIATEETGGAWYDEDTYGAGTYGTVIGQEP